MPMPPGFYRCADCASGCHEKWKKVCRVCQGEIGPACWDTHAERCPGSPAKAAPPTAQELRF